MMSNKDLTLRISTLAHSKLSELARVYGLSIKDTVDAVVNKVIAKEAKESPKKQKIELSEAVAEKEIRELENKQLLVIKPSIIELTRESSKISQFNEKQMERFILALKELSKSMKNGDKFLVNCSSEKNTVETVLFRSLQSLEILDILISMLNRGIEVYFAGEEMTTLELYQRFTDALKITYRERAGAYVGAWNALIGAQKKGKYKSEATVKSHLVQSIQWSIGFQKLSAEKFLRQLLKSGFQLTRGALIDKQLLKTTIESAKKHLRNKKQSFKIETNEELNARLDEIDEIYRLIDETCKGGYSFEEKPKTVKINGKEFTLDEIEKALKETGKL